MIYSSTSYFIVLAVKIMFTDEIINQKVPAKLIFIID